MLGVEIDWLFPEKDTIVQKALYPTPSWPTVYTVTINYIM